MSSPACSVTGSATVLDQSDDVESTLSALYEERPLLDSTDETWAPPKGFLWVQIAIMSNVFLSGFDGTITASTYAVISSEFNAANTASWLTTSYLITSTAFQPLYGRFSDIFGRRVSFFTATITFIIGCLGCGIADDIVLLNMMRALTGIGGGGLMTMATIVNSDLIPFKRRGMYQALQNGMHGFGSICGASFGGSIVDTVGWRWCFLVQVPIGLFALITGHLVLHLPRHHQTFGQGRGFRAILRYVDLSGALLLILGLSSQLIGLSLGGNELPWSSIWVILSLMASLFLLGLFMLVEEKTPAVPLIPSRMLRGVMPVSTQIANVCVGMAAYARQFLFTLPLLFQVVLLDTPTKAGARLAIPSLAAPIGSLIAGVVMSRWGRLAYLVRAGCLLMCIGNLLVMSIKFHDAGWKYLTYVIPASLGQGIVYPGILFTFLAAFDHTDHAVSASTVYLIRSLGTVWGVAITSAIIQNTLRSGLSKALSGIPDKWKVTSLKWSISIIEQIRHSVSAIQDLPPDIQMAARLVYHRGIRLSFAAAAGFAFLATIAALFSRESKRTASCSKPHDNGPLEIELATGQVIMGLPDMPMKRKFSILSIIAVGYNISNSWVAIAASFAIAVQSGGAVSLLYGIVAVTIAMLCTGVTLAELASVYPTAGGQYHFTSILASERWSRHLSYFSGLAAVFSWITLAASIAVASTQALMAVVIRWQPEYVPQAWHYFLVYQLFNIAMVVHNIFLTNRTLWVYNVGFLLSLGTFLTITVTCPARSHTTVDSFAIWTQFINGSGGWPNGISFLTGLSTPQFMLSGLDATLHLAEECLEPERIVPKAVLVTVVVGFLTAFPFSIAIIYSYRDVESSLSSPTGFPIYFIWEKATRSPTAATVFMAALVVISSIALNAVHQTASRLTWSFARDNALFFSRRLASVHPSLNVPVYALLLNGLLVLLVGIIYVCSTTAFNAFIGTTVIVAQISFAVPAALLIYRRRSHEYLPPSRPFKVMHVVGYVCNVMTVVWAVVITIFFTFPTTFPVTGGNMNYASVVLVALLLLGVANWFVYARRHYHGPRLEM
ncbi:hypothetical protein LV156_001014 [Aspergillus fumigatus]|nr:hypothetical protein LV156_001014 [Aspergillus fumigatus]KAJ8240897.1 hypothetical protein LV160_002862 [Aspergillus fumigatus]